MARMMALCSLPRTNPGNRIQYRRVNGPYKLVMIAGADKKLPYGNLPRSLLAWISTEAANDDLDLIGTRRHPENRLAPYPWYGPGW